MASILVEGDQCCMMGNFEIIEEQGRAGVKRNMTFS